MPDRTYEQGLTDGKIEALEASSADHSVRLDHHAGRLHLLEKAMWLMLGVVTAVEFLPELFALLNG